MEYKITMIEHIDKVIIIMKTGKQFQTTQMRSISDITTQRIKKQARSRMSADYTGVGYVSYPGGIMILQNKVQRPKNNSMQQKAKLEKLYRLGGVLKFIK